MANMDLSRREAVALTGAAAAGLWLRPAVAQTDAPAEFDLTDDDPIGKWAAYDATFFGPAVLRGAKTAFVFPADANVERLYGIDISHHTATVPWSSLQDARVKYVYIKASQGRGARDPKFVSHWTAGVPSGLPLGAYHFLSAGIPGVEQGTYFLKRLSEIGNLKSGHLQPVVDLEWDVLGPNFQKKKVGTDANGNPIWKDYWDDYKSQVVPIVRDCVKTIVDGLAPLGIRPLIYTNRTWWETHVPAATVFAGCTVWISDYRKKSYDAQQPRSVIGHASPLWQFTEKAKIRAGSNMVGPFDANVLLDTPLSSIVIP